MAELKDSGARREFDTGAVRDIAEGKGRCDLLPLYEVGFLYSTYTEYTDNLEPGAILSKDSLFRYITRTIDRFMIDLNPYYIRLALCAFIDNTYPNFETAMLELAIHYEDGAKKYSERNWQKGIPTHCFVDSAIRHLLKFQRGDTDERHDRAFMWNMMGLLWTMMSKKNMNDIDYGTYLGVKDEEI